MDDKKLEVDPGIFALIVFIDDGDKCLVLDIELGELLRKIVLEVIIVDGIALTSGDGNFLAVTKL